MDPTLALILLGLGLLLVGTAVVVGHRTASVVLAGIGLGLGAVVALIELFAKLGG